MEKDKDYSAEDDTETVEAMEKAASSEFERLIARLKKAAEEKDAACT